MGLLGKLLTLPISGPVDGVLWLANTLREQAERELYDVDRIRGQLSELELKVELGEITEEECTAAEDELMVRLSEARERQVT